MSQVCRVDGSSVGFGHSISHAQVRTKRRFKVLDRRGIGAVIAGIVAAGERI